MTERIAREAVTFDRPFFVEGLGCEQPAGTYEVETVEELIEGLSFLAWRLASTSIVPRPPGGGAHSRQLVHIDPSVVRSGSRNAGAAAAVG